MEENNKDEDEVILCLTHLEDNLGNVVVIQGMIHTASPLFYDMVKENMKHYAAHFFTYLYEGFPGGEIITTQKRFSMLEFFFSFAYQLFTGAVDTFEFLISFFSKKEDEDSEEEDVREKYVLALSKEANSFKTKKCFDVSEYDWYAKCREEDLFFVFYLISLIPFCFISQVLFSVFLPLKSALRIFVFTCMSLFLIAFLIRLDIAWTEGYLLSFGLKILAFVIYMVISGIVFSSMVDRVEKLLTEDLINEERDIVMANGIMKTHRGGCHNIYATVGNAHVQGITRILVENGYQITKVEKTDFGYFLVE